MPTNDPRYPDGWDTIDASTLVSVPALQLLVHVHHHLRQKVAIAAGLGQLLADGVFGFASSEQQAAISQLRSHIAAIEQTQQWMTEWMLARVDPDGNWMSDENGSLPALDRDSS